MCRRLAAFAALVFLIVASGCGTGRYPVAGRVAYEDGSPVIEGSVIGEMAQGDKKFMARGNVKSDGSFDWGIDRPGDGALPGKYRVIVVPRALTEGELSQGLLPAVDPKFSNPKTSGIDFEVKESKNELNISVSKPKGRSR